jgi:hypothetical protein
VEDAKQSWLGRRTEGPEQEQRECLVDEQKDDRLAEDRGKVEGDHVRPSEAGGQRVRALGLLDPAALHHSHVSEKQLAPAREDLVRLAQGRCGSWSILSVSSLASTTCSNQFCSPTDVRTSATTWTAAYAFSRL